MVFLTGLPDFQYQNENKLQPTKTSLSRNFQCKKAPRWLSKFFHFGTENRADQLKNHPVLYVVFLVPYFGCRGSLLGPYFTKNGSLLGPYLKAWGSLLVLETV